MNASTAGLFNAVVGDTYNSVYLLTWAITGFATVILSMVLRGGTVNYNRDDLISFTATFEKALPRTTVTINTTAIPPQSVPLLSFSFNRDYNVESIIKVEQVESRHVSSGATITARFAHDGSSISNLLLGDIINHTLDRVYTLTVGVANITSHIGNYIIRSGNYQFEQSGELLYEITFVKVVV
jgi:hypothetical protein